jgi:hypothetical protein
VQDFGGTGECCIGRNLTQVASTNASVESRQIAGWIVSGFGIRSR